MKTSCFSFDLFGHDNLRISFDNILADAHPYWHKSGTYCYWLTLDSCFLNLLSDSWHADNVLTWGDDVGHAGVALVPDGVAGVAQEAAVVLRRPREEGDGLAGHVPALASWGRASVTRRRHRKLNEFLKKRKVKRISVSFDAAAALSQVFANNEYFANYDELISLLYNYFKQFSWKNNKIQQTGKKQATK